MKLGEKKLLKLVHFWGDISREFKERSSFQNFLSFIHLYLQEKVNYQKQKTTFLFFLKITSHLNDCWGGCVPARVLGSWFPASRRVRSFVVDRTWLSLLEIWGRSWVDLWAASRHLMMNNIAVLHTSSISCCICIRIINWLHRTSLPAGSSSIRHHPVLLIWQSLLLLHLLLRVGNLPWTHLTFLEVLRLLELVSPADLRRDIFVICVKHCILLLRVAVIILIVSTIVSVRWIVRRAFRVTPSRCTRFKAQFLQRLLCKSECDPLLWFELNHTFDEFLELIKEEVRACLILRDN